MSMQDLSFLPKKIIDATCCLAHISSLILLLILSSSSIYSQLITNFMHVEWFTCCQHTKLSFAPLEIFFESATRQKIDRSRRTSTHFSNQLDLSSNRVLYQFTDMLDILWCWVNQWSMWSVLRIIPQIVIRWSWEIWWNVWWKFIKLIFKTNSFLDRHLCFKIGYDCFNVL